MSNGNAGKTMTDKLKSFFEKRRRDGKFKGQGHRLNESASKDDKNKYSTSVSQQERAEPSQEAKQAGLAALARLANKNTNTKPSHKFFRKEPTFSNNLGLETQNDPVKNTGNDFQELAAVQGVYFKCPLVGPEILTKEEWKSRIETFLYEQLDTEKGFTSCIMIHTLNKNKEKVEKCIDTLCAYLQNILTNPTEDKYKKIRFMNRIFQERVVNIIGAIEFLEAAGFVRTSMLLNSDQEEDVLVFTATEPDIPHLELMIDSLKTTEAVPLELYRNIQVLKPAEASIMTQLPDDFYALTADEMKREQKKKSNDLESSMQLKTKAMREKEEQRETRKYRYSLIRIRFPDDQLLQGTFGVYERFNAVREFVRNCIHDSVGPFNLANVFGTSFVESDDDKTLLDLKLVPAVILTFIPQTQNKDANQSYLLQDLQQTA